MAGHKWRVYRRRDPDLLKHLAKIRGIGLKDLEFDFAGQLHDPHLLPGMAAARELLVKAKKENWSVTIFGDYDADGTPAAALLASLLKRLEIDYQVIIPTRAEGYGLKVSDVEKIAKQSKLLITVDTGITAVEPIALLKNSGVSTIVLDHHLPKDILPDTPALVDPFLKDSKYPFNQLCGCALAYKFVVALAKDFPNELTESFSKWLLDLVAISTVADMMVMKGENRVLVHYGLQVLKKTRRPGLIALLKVAGVEPAKITAGTLGYTLGPRLNATGRIGDNRPAFDLLVCDQLAEAEKLAEQIELSNRERQQLVESVTAEAMSVLFIQNKSDDRCFVVAGDNWPPGVIGLVAGKIAGQFYRPTVVLTKQGDSLTGSARSVGEYSIIDGLQSQEKLLNRFGGHRQAAGLALAEAQKEHFIEGLKKHAKQNISPEQLSKAYQAEAVLSAEEIDLKTTDICELFQPFGMDNQAPLFIIENAKLSKPKILGSRGDHLKWVASVGPTDFEVIGFGWQEKFQKESLEKACLLGHLEKNEWNNQTKLQFRLVDLKADSKSIETID